MKYNIDMGDYMEQLQDNIQELEMLLNMMSDTTNPEKPLSTFGEQIPDKPVTLAEMKERLKKVKREYRSLEHLDGEEYNKKRLEIIKDIAWIEFNIGVYTRGGGLTDYFKLLLQHMQEEAEEIVTSKEALDERKESLDIIKLKYEETIKYMKKANVNVDTQQLEVSIARAILSIIAGKKERGEKIVLQEEIPDRYAHEVIMVIQEQAKEYAKGQQGDEKKKIADDILIKIQTGLLKKLEDRNWKITDLAHDEELMTMSLILNGHNIQQSKNIPDNNTSKETDEIEEKPHREKVEKFRRRKKVEFEKYRNKSIAYYQKVTKSFFPIRPGPNQVTIINTENEVEIMKFSEFIERIDEDSLPHIKVIIMGSNIKSFPRRNHRNISSMFIFKDLEDVIFNYGLEEIGESAFSGTKLRSLVLPPTIKEIGDKAFSRLYFRELDLRGCLELRKIGEKAFEYCRKLCDVKLPPHIEYIGEGAFDKTSLDKKRVRKAMYIIEEHRPIRMKDIIETTSYSILDGENIDNVRRELECVIYENGERDNPFEKDGE